MVHKDATRYCTNRRPKVKLGGGGGRRQGRGQEAGRIKVYLNLFLQSDWGLFRGSSDLD